MSTSYAQILHYHKERETVILSKWQIYHRANYGIQKRLKILNTFFFSSSTPCDEKKAQKGDDHFCSSTSISDAMHYPTSAGMADIVKEPLMKFEDHLRLMPDQVRQIMRNIPQSIAVLTTTSFPKLKEQLVCNSKDSFTTNNDLKSIGITLSSVNTVALQPEPIISFNIKRPSHTLNALRYHGHFLVHFPSCSKAGALLADSFSQKREYPKIHSQAQLEIRRNFDRSTPFPVINIQGQKINLPALFSPSYPVNYILKCEIYGGENGYLDIADHTIVVGKVQKTWCIKKPSGCSESTVPVTLEKIFGLAYIDGSYCVTGSKIQVR